MKRIMVIEDESIVQNNLADLLESNGYEVILANHGKEAINLLEAAAPPDLIISDISMPVMNGYELLDQLQRSKTRSTIPFIILTAHTGMDDLRRGMNKGADDYLTKPYDAKDLINAVKLRLEKKQKLEDEMEDLRTSIAKYLPHELRTPLVAISGYSQFILDDYHSLSNDEIYEMVEGIKAGNIRLHKTIEKFILYSELVCLIKHREEFHKLKAQVTPQAHLTIKEAAIIKAEELKREKPLQFVLQPCSLRISHMYLNILVAEIIENACKFSDPDTCISVHGFERDEYYELIVRDTGRGMSREQINKVNAFIQFDRDEFQQSGNGLGLAILKKILELFEGTLTLRSESGMFTEVTVKLKKQ